MRIEYLDLESNTENSYENYSTLQRRIVTKIFHIQNKYQIENLIDFDRIYVSHVILNMLSDASGFFMNPSTELDYSKPVAKLGGRLDVYLKDNLPRNQVLFSFESNLVRDTKIDSLLDQYSEYKLDEVILEIKSEFI